MNENKNLLYTLQVLGQTLEDKDLTIRAKQYRIESLEKEVQDLRNRITNEFSTAGQYESTIKAQKEYIVNLEAKLYDLEERVAIMLESESTRPVWEVTPNESVSDVTEVVNVTKVLGDKQDG